MDMSVHTSHFLENRQKTHIKNFKTEAMPQLYRSTVPTK